jgi:hypothetical protein
MNCIIPKYFHSPAERIVFPILNTIAISKKLCLTYQNEFGFQGGGYESKREYCEDNGKFYDGKETGWEDSSWESEEYRADYTFQSDEVRIVVEIDGAEYHQDKEYDKSRDAYFKRRGYSVVHIPAKMAFKRDFRIKEWVEQEIEKQRLADTRNPISFYFPITA